MADFQSTYCAKALPLNRCKKGGGGPFSQYHPNKYVRQLPVSDFSRGTRHPGSVAEGLTGLVKEETASGTRQGIRKSVGIRIGARRLAQLEIWTLVLKLLLRNTSKWSRTSDLFLLIVS